MSTSSQSRLDARDLLALLDTGAQLTSVETLEDVLTNILTLAGSLSESSAGSVILHDHERNDLYFAAATGPAADKVRGIRIPVGKGKAGEVFVTGQAVVENKIHDHYAAVDEQTDFATKSMICVPLRQQDHTVGVMQILNKGEGSKAYDERDLELLTRFATQATVAIRNATLFEQMLSSSGLYADAAVRRDLIQNLTRAGRSAIRDRFTVAFVDIAGFSQLCALVTSAEKVQTVLSDYVLMVGSVVVRQGGIVNKVMGDGVMAIFRGDRAADRAVQAALDVVEGFERLKTSWKGITRFNLDFLSVGVGITTDDDTILGTIGDNRFRDFTVIGTGVNLAAALVKAARGDKRIVCDDATYNAVADRSLASAEGPIPFRIEKSAALQGITYDVYSLRAFESPQETAAEKAERQYDIFFSYRREGGSDAARSLQLALKDHYKIFLDVDRMPSGHFDTSLLRTIEMSPNFVAFLSPGSLDRCASTDDWLRREIAHAITTKRNIVPVTLPGFAFPEPARLPGDIAEIVRHDAVEYSHRYFYAMLDKLREHLVRRDATVS